MQGVEFTPDEKVIFGEHNSYGKSSSNLSSALVNKRKCAQPIVISTDVSVLDPAPDFININATDDAVSDVV